MYNNKPMSKLNTADIAHTFTIQSTPDETNPIFVSVPLLGVADNAPSNTNVTGVDGNQYQYPAPNIIHVSVSHRSRRPLVYLALLCPLW